MNIKIFCEYLLYFTVSFCHQMETILQEILINYYYIFESIFSPSKLVPCKLNAFQKIVLGKDYRNLKILDRS